MLLELCDISSVDSNQLFFYFEHKHKVNTGKEEEEDSVANMCKENGLPECCTELVS